MRTFGLPVAVLYAVLTAACSSEDAATSPNDGGAGGGDAGAPALGTPHAEVLVEGAEIQGANGMFFDDSDRLFVASVSSQRLFVIDPDTGETLGIGPMRDVAVRAPGGHLGAGRGDIV